MRYHFNMITFWTAFLSAVGVSCHSIGLKTPDTGCKTPDGTVGECKLITECETIPFLRDVYKTTQQRDYLTHCICGFQGLESMICCPHSSSDTSVISTTVTTASPGGTTGECPATSLPPDPNSNCCGIHGLSPKIYGGTETGLDQYPWLVLLEYRDVDVSSILDTKCGGSLISGRYVLTAAQCVDASRTNLPESVRLGEYDTQSNIDCDNDDDNETNNCNDGSVSIPIQKIIVHPQFKPGKHPKNDIALLRLTKMATFSEFIRPICLPSTSATIPSNLYVAGWGATSTGHRSSVKMHVMVPLVNLTICNSYYHNQLQQGQMCAGGEMGKDTCKGDSGGPLMRNTGTHYEVLGVVSYGGNPCGYDCPGVYTNVMEYLDWITISLHE